MSVISRTRPLDSFQHGLAEGIQILHGANEVWSAANDIVGTLPMYFTSKSTKALKDYKLYGTSEGSGVETENLWDGTYEKCYYDYNDGKFYSPDNTTVSAIVACSPSTTYTIRKVEAIGNRLRIGCFSSYPTNGDTGQTLYASESGTDTLATVTTSNDASYLVIFVDYRYSGGVGGQLNVVPGSTAPASYIPPGYQIPLTNTSGVTENLIEGEIANCHITDTGALTSSPAWKMLYSPITEDETYTIVSDNVVYGFYETLPEIGSTAYQDKRYAPGGTAKTFTAPIDGWIAIRIAQNVTNVVMLVKGSNAPASYIPHRYSADYNLYIGSTKLGAEEYLDYAEQKVYKLKEVHKDTVTINGIEWDILGYDQDEVYKADGVTRAQHTVTIQAHDVLSSMQFDAHEAWYYAPNGLEAGAYYFTINPTYDTDHNTYKDSGYMFTLTQSVPAKGVLTMTWAQGANASGIKIASYASASATTAIESNIAVSEGTTGTNLGELTSAGDPENNLNSISRARYGSNNYKESAMRQYLNSSAAAGSVWTPQTKFDRPPSWATTTAGFLKGIDSEFLSVLGFVKKTTALNTITDGGGSQVTNEKVFLLSRSEIYAGNEVTGGEGAAYPYFKEFSDLSAAGTGADTNRIKYRNGSAQYWWLRSPNAGNTYSVRNVAPSGALNGNRLTANSNGVAPACCIILDDINTNPYLQSLFLKPTDPPAPFPAITAYEGENTLTSTVSVGEVTLTGRLSKTLGFALTQAAYDLFTPVGTLYYAINSTASGEPIHATQELSQAEYDNMSSHVADTLYIILDGTDIEDVRVGDTQADKLYLGSTVLWTLDPTPSWIPSDWAQRMPALPASYASYCVIAIKYGNTICVFKIQARDMTSIRGLYMSNPYFSIDSPLHDGYAAWGGVDYNLDGTYRRTYGVVNYDQYVGTTLANALNLGGMPTINAVCLEHQGNVVWYDYNTGIGLDYI